MTEEMPGVYPVLPLRNVVVYPQIVTPIVVGRVASLRALELVRNTQKKDDRGKGDQGKDDQGKGKPGEKGRGQRIVVVAQRKPDVDEPDLEDLYTIGTLSIVRQIKRQEGGAQVLVQGLERVAIKKKISDDPCLLMQVDKLPLPTGRGSEIQTLDAENRALGLKVANLTNPQIAAHVYEQIVAPIKDPLTLAYRMTSLASSVDVQGQQEILELNDLLELLMSVRDILQREQQVVTVQMEIADKTKSDIEQQQRESVLRQQKRAIENALGETNAETEDAVELRKRLYETKGLPPSVKEEAEREIKRMERMSPAAGDFQVIRTYIEFILELPWGKHTKDRLDLSHASKVLDEDHFGLEDVKERILEHLAVMQMNAEAKAPILCFVGPPGVGKTSLGVSIARSLGREFDRLALGGLHDEAELRGHRRTYVGAMPGRILQAIRRVGVNNPLLMLDEIDKLSRDFRGDPSAALMEILDPAQNSNFKDNYLNLPFDLSKVFFITTANSLDSVSRPLLDRMEVLEMSGYSDYEKREIANRYLIPKQREEAGLSKKQLNIGPAALETVIRRYTREAGVRELERTIARIARKQARRFLEDKPVTTVSKNALPDLLGPEKFFPEKTRQEAGSGVAAGLAWTHAGGDILHVEASLIAKSEKLHLTGQLGDVMKESAQAARSYIWRVASKYVDIERSAIESSGVHIHVPAGAVPKDGPSAGVTIASALASVYSNCPVHSEIAMTGEITLTGLVLPVGGIKEKILAAHRAGLRRVLLPEANAHDLVKIPEHVHKEMEFSFVENLMDVFRIAIPKLRLKSVVAA